MARLTSSPEAPVPVRVVAQKIGEWIARLGEIWVDGQIAQLTRRPGVATQFLTLRDPDANISLTVTCARGRPARRRRSRAPGSSCAPGRTSTSSAACCSLRASEIRQVGLGELLARLEALRRLLAAEGLFAAERKRPLPFLPRRDRADHRPGQRRRTRRRRERAAAAAGASGSGSRTSRRRARPR